MHISLGGFGDSTGQQAIVAFDQQTDVAARFRLAPREGSENPYSCADALAARGANLATERCHHLLTQHLGCALLLSQIGLDLCVHPAPKWGEKRLGRLIRQRSHNEILPHHTQFNPILCRNRFSGNLAAVQEYGMSVSPIRMGKPLTPGIRWRQPGEKAPGGQPRRG